MKSLILFLSLIIGYAAPSYADLVCRASDKGWEEHSGHGSCGECLQKHGQCEETCSVRFETCTGTGRDIRGRTITLKASGDSRYDAENRVLDNCRRYLNECRVSTCNSSSEVISRQTCVRPAGTGVQKITSQLNQQ